MDVLKKNGVVWKSSEDLDEIDDNRLKLETEPLSNKTHMQLIADVVERISSIRNTMMGEREAQFTRADNYRGPWIS